jgi:transcriptional regulator with XRE-family HTH domain
MQNPAEHMRLELQRIMQECKIPLMELSRRSGVAYNTLRSLQRGEGNPTLSTAEAIFGAIFARRTDMPGRDCMNCAMRGSDLDESGFYLCELALLGSDNIAPCSAHVLESKE